MIANLRDAWMELRPSGDYRPKADQFGLWPQSAAAPDALLCTQIKSCRAFLELQSVIKPTGIISGAIARNRKNWEIVADNLKKAGFRCGCTQARIKAGDNFGLWAAEREDAGSVIVHADEMLTAFLERQHGKSCVVPCFSE